MHSEFAIVLHFHQPVGNFDDVVARVTERCYRPLLALLDAHPSVRTHLHLNGILLGWMDRHAPDLVATIDRMVRRGSVEMVGGGHQEPILPVLPERDAVGQIVRLSDELERRFGRRPRGLWLTERVWEPRLPTPLVQAGVRWTVLDDTILRSSGLPAEALTGFFMAEDLGAPLALYAGSKALRYTIPFRPHDETFQLLRDARRGDRRPALVVYADDAEKFGEWPGTHDWVYRKGWLQGFLSRLAQEPAVRTVHLSEHLDTHLPEGRVYPPTASYHEMTEWALPTPARVRLERLVAKLDHDDPLGAREFVRGGHWRGFLAKYPESDRIHKKMLRVSERVAAAQERRPDDPRLQAARRDLYAGQCNDAYWHGSFGGLYLVHLRRALETHLIRAERTLDAMEQRRKAFVVRTERDLDADGRAEVEIRTPRTQLVIDPDGGGAVVEWDLRDACENLTTVLQRHEEAFHETLRSLPRGQIEQIIQQTAALEKAERGEGDGDGIATIHGPMRIKAGVRVEDLRVDGHRRSAGLTWIAGSGAPAGDPDAFAQQATLLSGPWDLVAGGDPGEVVLSTSQEGWRVRRTLTLVDGGPGLHVAYRIDPPAEGGPWLLGSEWNLLIGHTGDDLVLEADPQGASAQGWRPGVERLRFAGGGGRSLEVECTPHASVAWSPVHTISSSEGGLEKTGQGSAFLFTWLVSGPTTAELRLRPHAPRCEDASA